jgi:hypothetical protein
MVPPGLKKIATVGWWVRLGRITQFFFFFKKKNRGNSERARREEFAVAEMWKTRHEGLGKV